MASRATLASSSYTLMIGTHVDMSAHTYANARRVESRGVYFRLYRADFRFSDRSLFFSLLFLDR